MAAKSSQTATGKAVYLLRRPLRVPGERDPEDTTRGFGRSSKKAVWLDEGAEVSEDKLEGLVIPALEYIRAIEKVSEALVRCADCDEHGTQAEGKKTYTRSELQAHYTNQHVGLAPEEVTDDG